MRGIVIGSSACLSRTYLTDDPHSDGALRLTSFKARFSDKLGLSVLTQSCTVPWMESIHTILSRLAKPPQAGQAVMLCPMGRLAKLRALSADSHDYASKEEIRNQLHSINIQVPLDIHWIEFDVENGSGVWPANLVFCARAAALSDYDIKSEDKYDRITRVQDWFLNKSIRDEAVERAKKEQEKGKATDSDYADRESSNTGRSPVSPLVAIQDVAGIYPTPSDGFPSQVPEAEQATPMDGIDREFPEPQVPNMLGKVNGRSSSIDGDMDLFTANDLTEADFNFFDEPDLDIPDELVPEHDIQSATTRFDIESIFKHPSNPTIADDLDVESHSDSPQNKPTKDKELNSTKAALPSSPDQLSDQTEVVAEPEDHPKSTPQPGAEAKDTITTESILIEIRDSRSAFNPISLTGPDFNAKYGSQGRYGYHPERSSSRREDSRTEVKHGRKQSLVGVRERIVNLGSSDSEVSSGMFYSTSTFTH